MSYLDNIKNKRDSKSEQEKQDSRDSLLVSIGETVEALAKKTYEDQSASKLAESLSSVAKIKGAKGDRGPKGEKGEPGKDGKDGTDGLDGVDGYTPIKGIDYFDGKDGKDGKPGKDGRDGLDGKDGKRGPKGEKGEKGDPGPAGPVSFVTQAGGNPYATVGYRGEVKVTEGDQTPGYLKDKLIAGSNITLTEVGEQLRVSASGGGGGGGQVNSITAGTGIDVDSTDPAAPVVSLDSATQASLSNADSAVQPGDNVSDLSNDAGYLTSAPVASVNGQTGVVSIDADDVDDTSTTNKFVDSALISKVAGIESGAEVNNISDANATDLTDAGDTTLHFHSADRNRANHTGTQAASTISDFDTEVSNNTDVAANTAARHAAVTLAGEDFLSLTGQQVTANPINLDNLSATGTPDSTTFLRGDNTWATPAGGAVDSVNGQTGTVVLDADDIDDTSTTNKFVTASDLTTLSNTSGTNTGDQDLSAYQLKPSEGAFVNGDKTKLDGIEAGADVTDTANVTAAGALMDSEVTSLSGIKTLTVPDSTTISAFGAGLIDDADNTAARTTLGLGTLSTASTIDNGNWSGTDLSVANGGTGRSTSTTAYGLIAAGTTATGAHQTLATGTSGQILKSNGASALPTFQTGTGADVGLGNVDNTSDVNKPISTATQTALDDKVAKDELVLNALDYGAVASIAVDNTAAFQAGIDESSSTGKVLLIPPGDYGIEGFLIMKPNLHIRAYGAVLHSIGTAAGMFVNWETGDTTTAEYDGYSDITIEGGIYDTHADTLGTPAGNTFTFNHCRNILMRDVTCRRVRRWHGIELNAVDTATLINCQFEGYYDPAGTNFGKEMIQIDIANPGSVDSGLEDGTTTRNVNIIGCVARPYGSMDAAPCLVGSHSRTAGVYYEDINVIGCRTESTTYMAIRPYAWRNSTIVGNNIMGNTGSNAAIGVQYSANVKVGPNTITNTAGQEKVSFDSDSIDDNCHTVGDDSGWLSLGYGSGFGVQSFGHAAGYRRIDDMVYLRGTTLKTSGNISGSDSPYGTLPAGYRPAAVTYFLAKVSGTGHVTGQINTNGTIQINAPSVTTNWMTLDQISFSTR